MISPTGIWSDEEAELAHAFSYYTARFIGKYFESQNAVVDIGCGKGTYLDYLSDIGFKWCFGVEGSVLRKIDFRGTILHADLSKDIKGGASDYETYRFFEQLPLLCRRVNVISIEVFEHIPPQFEKQFVENIITICNNKLVISVAVEGQPGIGHVNCRNNDYVINLFESYGFGFKPKETELIREDIEPHVAYLKNTLMVFEKK